MQMNKNISNFSDVRLFLYIDILGFSKMISDHSKVERLFNIIDGAKLHTDSNYEAVVFSDTILVYNKYANLSYSAKVVEYMYLIELVQDLLFRLSGENIFFRAIITEGQFILSELKNIKAYYGNALVDCYNDEKKLNAIGLFADIRTRQYNEIYKHVPFTEKYDFVYLLQKIERFGTSIELFPIDANYVVETDLQYFVYPELIHLNEIYTNMHGDFDENTRLKYSNTWEMYASAFPAITSILVKESFDYRAISNVDWDNVKRSFYQT